MTMIGNSKIYKNLIFQRGGLIGPLFFLFWTTSTLANPLRVAIFDTGFCPSKLHLSHHQMKKIITIPNDVHYDCQKINLEDRRYHGHYVAQQFLSNLKTKYKIQIYPFVIFDKHGVQKYEYWKKALELAQKAKVDVILAAAGLPVDKSFKQNKVKIPKTIMFLASGKVGKGIRKETSLFPQLFHKKPNILLIGSYHPPMMKDDFLQDSGLLYKQYIDYYFSGGKGTQMLRGASRAVATALARAITVCHPKYFSDALNLRNCLEQVKSKRKFDGVNEFFYQY